MITQQKFDELVKNCERILTDMQRQIVALSAKVEQLQKQRKEKRVADKI